MAINLMIPELRARCFVIVSALIVSSTALEAGEWKFDFGSGKRSPGATLVTPQMSYEAIDLHAMSLKFYAALGPEKSTKAFAHYPANTFPGQDKPLKDDTHHNNYGGYELARCIVEGIKANVPALVAHLAKDAGSFDPSNPDLLEKVNIPASPVTGATEKPAGN